VENLLSAWQEFVRGKRRRQDVQLFGLRLMENIFALHYELNKFAYLHGGYKHFRISDPKPRDIHKASVRDRLLHHALYRKLYPFFDRTFIADSYSCRLRKGTHRALQQFQNFGHGVSKNNTCTCWVLKCDIRKFFASIDHHVLFEILDNSIVDEDVRCLLKRVVSSFSSAKPGVGLPLGNLTSQLLVNIYMNEFDHFVKHTLRARYYIRYADDFVMLSETRGALVMQLARLQDFLRAQLHLLLHPNKVSITTRASGVDYLGWVHFADHKVLRTTTKKRMFRGLEKKKTEATLASYLGLLSYGNTQKLRAMILAKRVGENMLHCPHYEAASNHF